MSTDPKHHPPFEPGQWVEIDGMAGAARVLEIDARRRRARVQLGAQEWVLPLKRLRPADPPDIPEPPPRTMVRVTGGGQVRHEVDLHGMRVEEALATVDQALDQAVVHRLTQLKIIHGHGTGAVRGAVRHLLEGHPHVSHFRFGNPMEGGLACTVAELRPARP